MIEDIFFKALSIVCMYLITLFGYVTYIKLTLTWFIILLPLLILGIFAGYMIGWTDMI